MSELQSIIGWEATILQYLESAEQSLACQELCTFCKLARKDGNVFETG